MIKEMKKKDLYTIDSSQVIYDQKKIEDDIRQEAQASSQRKASLDVLRSRLQKEAHEKRASTFREKNLEGHGKHYNEDYETLLSENEKLKEKVEKLKKRG